MTPFEKNMAAQREENLVKLRFASRAIASWANKSGVVARIFGSFARGTADRDSDIDILLMSGFEPRNRFRVASQVEAIAAEHGVKADIAFFDLSPELAEGSIPCS